MIVPIADTYSCPFPDFAASLLSRVPAAAPRNFSVWAPTRMVPSAANAADTIQANPGPPPPIENIGVDAV